MAVSYNFIKNDSTILWLSLPVRVEKKIREKKREECYCRHKELLQISHHAQHSLARNSLFKWIKIQRMQVFWRDEPDCCYSVQIYLTWNSEFCIIWKTANWLAAHVQSSVPFVVLHF